MQLNIYDKLNSNKAQTLLQDFFRIMENITPIFVQVQDDNNVGMLQLVAFPTKKEDKQKFMNNNFRAFKQ